MNDRPLTMVFIAVAILVALYIRRARGGEYRPLETPSLITPEQARIEGAKRGVEVTLSKPITRSQFEELVGK